MVYLVTKRKQILGKHWIVHKRLVYNRDKRSNQWYGGTKMPACSNRGCNIGDGAV